MRRDRRTSGNKKQSRGFTLFEVVIVISLIVMLYMTAERRMNELPAAAERASFYAVLAQLKTGLNLEMLARVSRGGFQEARALEGMNPMDLLLEVPGNYRGMVASLQDTGSLRRASWYFERSSGELVYLVGETNVNNVSVAIGGVPVNTGQLRFRIGSAYGSDSNISPPAAGSGQASGWQGLLLVPVYAFEWERVAEQPVGF